MSGGAGFGADPHLRVIVERLRSAPTVVSLAVAANVCGIVAFNDPQRHVFARESVSAIGIGIATERECVMESDGVAVAFLGGFLLLSSVSALL
jgi:hypothetical protein